MDGNVINFRTLTFFHSKVVFVNFQREKLTFGNLFVNLHTQHLRTCADYEELQRQPRTLISLSEVLRCKDTAFTSKIKGLSRRTKQNVTSVVSWNLKFALLEHELNGE